MKRKTVKERMTAAIQEKAQLQEKILNSVGRDNIIAWLQHDILHRFHAIDKEIEGEQNFADENKAGAYRSAGMEARQIVKSLKKRKKKMEEAASLLGKGLIAWEKAISYE